MNNKRQCSVFFMPKSVFATALTFILWLSLSSCESTNNPADQEFDELNNQLLQLLISKSGNGRADYFQMPASNDYSSIPQDPKNPITQAKVELGKLLYHETCITILPKNTKSYMHASCASCHHVAAGFQAGLAQGIGVGGLGFGAHGEARHPDESIPIEDCDLQPIKSPSSMNVAWQKNMLWNGQFGATGLNVGTEANWTAGSPKEKNLLGYEGIETQAIAGQTVHRMKIEESLIKDNIDYINMFKKAFPNTPANNTVNTIDAGLAIAAYERTLLANQSPFQKWLAGNKSAMNKKMLKGALVFFGKANCVECHTGPALNSMNFYAQGLKDLEGEGTYGTGKDKTENKGRGGFTGKQEDMYKFKVPQLYNVIDAGFLGHGSSFKRVRDFVVYMNNGVPENPDVPLSLLPPSFKPLALTDDEIDNLTEFVSYALKDNNLARYVPALLPSGFCFPNNDPQSKKDLGCN